MTTVYENIKLTYSNPLDLKGFSEDPAEWFLKQPAVGDDAWLLAYADDGVIWGKIENKQLVQACQVFGDTFPRLEATTLHKAHFFGSGAEVRVFRHGDKFRAIRLQEENDPAAASYTRSYYLWGDHPIKTKGNWSWLEDGQLGIFQALPLAYPPTAKGREFQLWVRYYLQFEEGHGQASVAASRLVGLHTLRGKS